MKRTCARDKKLRELNLRPQMLKSWTVFVRCKGGKTRCEKEGFWFGLILR